MSGAAAAVLSGDAGGAGHALAEANAEQLRLVEAEMRRMRLEMERMAETMENHICAICMDMPRDTYLQPCGHTFCACCVGRLQQAAQLQRCPPLCPTCRAAFSSACRIFA